MLTRVRIALLATLAAAFIVACDAGSDSPTIEIGVSTCVHCAATIEDPSWAAADGDSGLYDDPGCLLAALRTDKASASAVRFQDRTGSGAWISGNDVWLARSQAFKSPQSSGWAAYSSFAAAQEAVTGAGSGEIVRLAEAIKASASPR